MDQPPAASSAPAAARTPPASARTSGAETAKSGGGSGGVKETIESILVAFILAFIFRAFVVEAFVIPTGSMAPTLLGAHIRFNCADCGYEYDINYSAQNNSDADQRADDIYIPSQSTRTHAGTCPNCGYEQTQHRPLVRYGDRILVLKYLDALDRVGLVDNPKRWEVVVFKNPQDGKYQQNYIKRLVALPNESVLILDGDVYTAPTGTTDVTKFQIQRKSADAQNALWRIVYHNDYVPRGLDRLGGETPWQQPWRERTAGAGWTLGSDQQTGRTFTFDRPDGAASIVFDREASPRKRALTDWLAYDVFELKPSYNLPYVSDLLLDLYYTRKAGDGPLRLALKKADDNFVAELTPDRVRLIRIDGSGNENVLQDQPADLAGDRPRHLRFSNVDYRVTLEIDGRAVVQTTDAQYSPDPAELLKEFSTRTAASLPPVVEVTAANQQSELRHVSLWRDVYYINTAPQGTWATPSNFPSNVVNLGGDEYFVLGDNSAISSDARYWTQPVSLPDEQLEAQAGTVPGRFLLGRAFFVYWPAGYPVTGGSPALVPNFGEMRFIH